ncbi:hypothetical protein C9426_31775 [Serratia sp. S1B]|nr:hypothetical protein C9426_31775 [Serratia sp. S1B]
MNCNEWLDEITTWLAAARKEQDIKNQMDALKFTVFRYIYPDENGLSRILADLLDVKNVHGQGDLFLRRFLDWFPATEKWDTTTPSFVECEQHTDAIGSKRRIDIVVQGNHWLLGIENKPWATDQPNQILDYLNEFEQRSSSLNKTLLIYLSPNGERPSQSSINKQQCDIAIKSGKLALLSYKDIVDWLDKLIGIADIPYRLRIFLDDLQRYIVDEVLFDKGNAEMGIMLEKIFSNEAALDTTLNLLTQRETIYKKLIQQATNDLKDVVQHTDWEICRQLSTEYGIGLRPPQADGWHYCIEPGKGYYQDWIYGIKHDDKQNITEHAAHAAKCLKTDFPTGTKSSEWWPYYRSFNGYLSPELDPAEYRDWLSSTQAWLDMYNGTFSSRCFNLIKRLHESVISDD